MQSLPQLAGLVSGLQTHTGRHVPPQLNVHQLLIRWSIDWVPTTGILVVAGLYFMGLVTLRERGDHWQWGRALAFFGGLFVTAYAVIGPLGAYDDVLFSAHMAQHMLLAMIIPPLLALGAPITLALRTLPAKPRSWLMWLLQSPIGRLMSSPIIGFALMAVSPWVLYFSPIYGYTLQHVWAHDLVHLHFLLVGCIFFWPLLGIDPLPHRPPHWMRVVLLFLMLPFHAFLGLALMSDTTPIAAAQYAAVGRTWGASVLSDQHTGGGLIWGAGDIVSGFLFFIVLLQWSRADERETKRLDRAMDRAEALAARRAMQEKADKREAEETDALAAYNARLAQLAEET